MKRLIKLHFLLILLVLPVACNSSDETKVNAPASSLPLLALGKHISFIKGFNAQQPQATNMAMQQKWQEAVDAGMKVGRVQIDWLDLEPEPNQFDKHALEEALSELTDDGLQPFVILSTIDSEGYTQNTSICAIQQEEKLLYSRHKVAELVILI